jgi:hypothetical protein
MNMEQFNTLRASRRSFECFNSEDDEEAIAEYGAYEDSEEYLMEEWIAYYLPPDWPPHPSVAKDIYESYWRGRIEQAGTKKARDKVLDDALEYFFNEDFAEEATTA